MGRHAGPPTMKPVRLGFDASSSRPCTVVPHRDLPISVGTTPINELYESVGKLIFERTPNCDGIVPLIRFVWKDGILRKAIEGSHYSGEESSGGPGRFATHCREL